jgi:protein-tyrosine phosphatase
MYSIRPWLFIGKYRETREWHYLRSCGIGAMLQLAERVEQPNITSLYLAVEDGEPLKVDLLQQGVAFVREQKADGRPILVACGAGISRSATFALAALKEEENLSLLDAYGQIILNHPDAMPHPALWESLCLYYHEPSDYWALVHQRRSLR